MCKKKIWGVVGVADPLCDSSMVSLNMTLEAGVPYTVVPWVISRVTNILLHGGGGLPWVTKHFRVTNAAGEPFKF